MKSGKSDSPRAATTSADDLALLDALAEAKSRESLSGYLDHVVIDSRPTKKRFGDAADPWQWDICGHVIPMIEHAVGNRDDYAGPRLAWIQLAKGHDKTSLIARLLMWAIVYGKNAKHSVKAVAAASDAKQAGILLDAAKREAKCNPWLNKHLTWLDYKVYNSQNKESNLEIISSDAPSSSGYLFDICVIDELTFHKKRELFDMLMAGQGKRPNACLIIITNAGIIDTWQWEVLNAAKADAEHWYVEDTPGHRASWISERDNIARAATMLPSVIQRVFKNKWTTVQDEGDYLERTQLEACIDEALCEQAAGRRGVDFVLTMDYGAVKDRATAAITHHDHKTGLVTLDKLWIFQGSHQNRTPIDLMIEWGNFAVNNFRIKDFWLDPKELEAVAQKFERLTNVRRYSFGGDGHMKMAENFRNLVINRKWRTYRGAGRLVLKDGTVEDLIDEAAALVMVAVGNRGNYRFDHRPGKHDDRTTVVALGALGAVSQKPRFDIHEVLDDLIQGKPSPEALQEFLRPLEDTMAAAVQYAQVKYIKTYGTFQAYPLIGPNNSPIPLGDWAKQDWAAFQVNCAFEAVGLPAPNGLPEGKIPPVKQEEIRADTEKRLRARLILKEQPPKVSAAVVSKLKPKTKPQQKELPAAPIVDEDGIEDLTMPVGASS